MSEPGGQPDRIRGVLVPLVVLALIAGVTLATDQPAAGIGLLAAVPLLSAVFATTGATALVAVLTFLAALGLALGTGEGDVTSLTMPLVGVILLAAVAVVASRFRSGLTPAAPEAPVRRKGTQFQIQTQANTDAMTGLLNRRGAIHSLGQRNDGPDKVLAYLDCDHFKEVNDEFGAEVGDEYLQAIAGRLRHSMPPLDTVARWDGDEFLVAMVADAETARPALDRVMAVISSHPIRTTAGPIRSSVSVGAAVWASGEELESAISRAGQALYAAKSGGGAQIVVDGEGGRVVGAPASDEMAMRDS